MPPRAHSLLLLRKLTRLLGEVPRRAGAEPVHQLRTTIRRVESVLENTQLGSAKLRRRLRSLRRRAGRVRDLDIQAQLLKTVRSDGHPEQKEALARKLVARRAKQEKKLLAALDERASSIRHSLTKVQGKLASASLGEPASLQDPVGTALERFAEIGARSTGLTAESLHAFRTECKRTRYLAEMAGEDPDGVLVVRELKRIQDAIGSWHDWRELLACAQEVLSDHPHALLVGVLRTATAARFAEALRTVAEVRDSLRAMRNARGKRGPSSSHGPQAFRPPRSMAG